MGEMGEMVEDLQTIRFSHDGDVLIATIDNPASDLNAVDAQLHEDFGALFRMLKRSHARAVLLTGSKKAFCAGGDFGWFPKLRAIPALLELHVDAKQMIWDLLDAPMPIVAGLNGSAAGLGASIALLCDLVVMSERASIVDPHVSVGLVAGDGGAAIWPLVLGPLAAKRHLLLGDPLGAADALRLGVAAEVCRAEDVHAASLRWAHRLGDGAPIAVRGTKAAVNAQLKRALLDSFDVSTALEIPCFLSSDHAEALAAMQDKRTPKFTGA